MDREIVQRNTGIQDELPDVIVTIGNYTSTYPQRLRRQLPHRMPAGKLVRIRGPSPAGAICVLDRHRDGVILPSCEVGSVSERYLRKVEDELSVCYRSERLRCPCPTPGHLLRKNVFIILSKEPQPTPDPTHRRAVIYDSQVRKGGNGFLIR